MKWVNFGGGHLMTRQGYDVEHLIGILPASRSRHPHLQVILEPGSAISWETGVLVSTVLDIIQNKGIKRAILDVSWRGRTLTCIQEHAKSDVHAEVDSLEGNMMQMSYYALSTCSE